MTHGAPDIYLRSIFKKSVNGIVNKNKDVHFGFDLNNRIKDSVEGKVAWQVTTDQKKPNVLLISIDNPTDWVDGLALGAHQACPVNHQRAEWRELNTPPP